MEASERRNKILRILCRRRYETVPNLAFEFGVSTRTIRRDIDVLSETYPIYTKAGRQIGGIYILDNYTLERMYMNDEEICVLQKILDFAISAETVLTPEETRRLQDIIALYSKPKPEKRKI